MSQTSRPLGLPSRDGLWSFSDCFFLTRLPQEPWSVKASVWMTPRKLGVYLGLRTEAMPVGEPTWVEEGTVQEEPTHR